MKYTDLYKFHENKAANFKDTNYAPNIGKDETLSNDIIRFYKKYPNFKDTLDWSKHKDFKPSDFKFIYDYLPDENGDVKIKSKGQKKRDAKKDVKLIFNREDVLIQGEYEDWVFVSPLTYEAAKWMDSFECGGAGARWCIGWERDSRYWEDYINKGYAFILAFRKDFESFEDKNAIKYMIQFQPFLSDSYFRKGNIWNQPDASVIEFLDEEDISPILDETGGLEDVLNISDVYKWSKNFWATKIEKYPKDLGMSRLLTFASDFSDLDYENNIESLCDDIIYYAEEKGEDVERKDALDFLYDNNQKADVKYCCDWNILVGEGFSTEELVRECLKNIYVDKSGIFKDFLEYMESDVGKKAEKLKEAKDLEDLSFSNVDAIYYKNGERHLIKNINVKRVKNPNGYITDNSEDDMGNPLGIYPIIDYSEIIKHLDNPFFSNELFYVKNVPADADIRTVSLFRKFYNCILDKLSYNYESFYSNPVYFDSCKIGNLTILDEYANIILRNSTIINLSVPTENEAYLQLMDSKVDSTDIKNFNSFGAVGKSDIGLRQIKAKKYIVLGGDSINIINRVSPSNSVEIVKENNFGAKRDAEDFSSVAEMLEWSKE